MSTESSPARIGVILSSTRQGRRGEGFAKWIHVLVAERPGVEVELIDLREYPLPAYAHQQMPNAMEKSYTDEVARRWSEKIHGLDGYVIVTPEYNHGYPGNLKNAIDHVHLGWWYKPVAFVSYGGTASGARAVEQLRNVAVEVRMVPVRGEVNIRLIGLELDDQARPKDPFYPKVAKAMIDQLLWWARATKHARTAETPPAF
jgi:NAD(P)H-dependent FMN reductase